MKRLLYIILYVVLAASASAQVKVTGRVIDLQNKPVSDVIVKLVSGTKTLAFTSSNAKGEYSLELKSAPSGEVTLQFFASKATTVTGGLSPCDVFLSRAYSLGRSGLSSLSASIFLTEKVWPFHPFVVSLQAKLNR